MKKTHQKTEILHCWIKIWALFKFSKTKLQKKLYFIIIITFSLLDVSFLLAIEAEAGKTCSPVHAKFPFQDGTRTPMYMRHDHRTDAESERRSGKVRGFSCQYITPKSDSTWRWPVDDVLWKIIGSSLQSVGVWQRLDIVEEIHTHPKRRQTD